MEEQVRFEDEFEMFSEEAKEEFEKLCEGWNDKHKFMYYEEEPKIVVRIRGEVTK
jgi:hypothetical protein